MNRRLNALTAFLDSGLDKTNDRQPRQTAGNMDLAGNRWRVGAQPCARANRCQCHGRARAVVQSLALLKRTHLRFEFGEFLA